MSKEPNWKRLQDENFVKQIVHIGSHYNDIIRLKEPITHVNHMAMFLAAIRPAKCHLLKNKKWDEIALSIWEKDKYNRFVFKRAHSLSYAFLVIVHMNLMEENGR